MNHPESSSRGTSFPGPAQGSSSAAAVETASQAGSAEPEPPSPVPLGAGGFGFLCFLSIVAAAAFATLSASLLRAQPDDVARAAGEGPRDKDGEHKAAPIDTDTLSASASLLAVAARASAAVSVFLMVLRAITEGGTSLPLVGIVLLSAAVSGFLLHLTTTSIPLALAQSHGERVVRTFLPPMSIVLRPLGVGIRALSAIRRMILRAIGTPDTNVGTRRLVEGFRAMVESAEMDGDLQPETRELIANVIEFGAADAAEVMTPRTEVIAIDADDDLAGAIAMFADSGYSRIPVYVETIDTIIGTLTALEAAKAVAEDRVDTTPIRSVMRPPLLVPETQLVPELLREFREQRQKMAIVVDEYGGTAGLVTLADVMAEIVGHVQDEFEAEEAPPYQRLSDGRVRVDASEHVADINELAFLSIPEEEDYETLAGFVLSEFGRFPAQGEAFEKDGVRYEVAEASDRRVMSVILDTQGGIQLADEAGRVEATGPEPPPSAAPSDATPPEPFEGERPPMAS